jgi:lactoylglutathione lyase
MKFGYTILYVPDVAAAVEFYERAFGLQRRFVHESGQYAALETGETALAFAAEAMAELNHVEVRPNRKAEVAPGIELALTDEDTEAAFARAVAAGAEPVHAVVV